MHGVLTSEIADILYFNYKQEKKNGLCQLMISQTH